MGQFDGVMLYRRCADLTTPASNKIRRLFHSDIFSLNPTTQLYFRNHFATTSNHYNAVRIPFTLLRSPLTSNSTMLATILSSAVASLAAALRFLADGLAAIAYANNVSRSTIPPTVLYMYTKFSSRSMIPMSSSRLPAPV